MQAMCSTPSSCGGGANCSDSRSSGTTPSPAATVWPPPPVGSPYAPKHHTASKEKNRHGTHHATTEIGNPDEHLATLRRDAPRVS